MRPQREKPTLPYFSSKPQQGEASASALSTLPPQTSRQSFHIRLKSSFVIVIDEDGTFRDSPPAYA